MMDRRIKMVDENRLVEDSYSDARQDTTSGMSDQTSGNTGNTVASIYSAEVNQRMEDAAKLQREQGQMVT
jgi:hypothetical protein